jgi:hypothetical protein
MTDMSTTFEKELGDALVPEVLLAVPAPGP